MSGGNCRQTITQSEKSRADLYKWGSETATFRHERTRAPGFPVLFGANVIDVRKASAVTSCPTPARTTRTEAARPQLKKLWILHGGHPTLAPRLAGHGGVSRRPGRWARCRRLCR